MDMKSARLARHTGRFDAVASFYRDLLGFRVVRQWDRGPSDRGAILAPPGEVSRFTVEVLEQGHTTELSDHCSFGVEVDDVDAVHRHLVDRGADIDKPPRDSPWGHRTLNVRDPDGFSVWIYQELT